MLSILDPNDMSPKNILSEFTSLLASGFLRLRKRRVGQENSFFLENSLDDVPPSGKLRTTENRTLEKGDSRP